VTSEDDHLRDMLEQLLLTSPGERVNRPDFGCGLLRYTFEPNAVELTAAVQVTVQSAIQRWLGDVIEARSVQVRSEDATVEVQVQYLVRRTQETQRATFRWSAP
jgi:hypothetical protein